MSIFSDPLEALHNPEVKKYFLEVLGNKDSSSEDKYGTLVRFFEREQDLTSRLEQQLADKPQRDPAAVSRAVVSAATDSGIWQPDLILRRTEEGLKRALLRVKRSQHSDGGWGHMFNESNPWATAWTVLLLHRAAEAGFAADKGAEEEGKKWLIEKNRCLWSLAPEDMRAGECGECSIYDSSLAMGALFATGAAALPNVSPSIERSLSRLLAAQRPEGDWDTMLCRNSAAAAHEDKLDVGGTSFALQVLFATGRSETRMKKAAGRALAWLAKQQNPDGSWNASYVPAGTIGPLKSVGKTCDALRGFLAGDRLGVDLAPYWQDIDRGVQWLVGKEEAVFNEKGQIEGWAWESEAKTSDGKVDLILIENTCLTLETLLDVAILPDIETVSLPQLAANALWLLRNQVHDEGRPDDDDDGKWPSNDTGRIAFALLNYYSRIQKSPFFKVAPAVAAPAVPVEVA